eukprot:COSAG01_NODE_4491_length_4978_cov_17.492109_2_plen_185_part_00
MLPRGWGGRWHRCATRPRLRRGGAAAPRASTPRARYDRGATPRDLDEIHKMNWALPTAVQLEDCKSDDVGSPRLTSTAVQAGECLLSVLQRAQSAAAEENAGVFPKWVGSCCTIEERAEVVWRLRARPCTCVIHVARIRRLPTDIDIICTDRKQWAERNQLACCLQGLQAGRQIAAAWQRLPRC